MYCLRCGKDTNDENVFCDGCLLLMEAYPVKPGTAIHLPERKKQPEMKKQRKVLSQAEQLRRARFINRALGIFSLLLVAVIAAAVTWYFVFK